MMKNVTMGSKNAPDYDDGERSFHWVDINSRYPNDEEADYIITAKNGAVTIGHYDKKSNSFFDNARVDAIAWAKVPKGYKTKKQ